MKNKRLSANSQGVGRGATTTNRGSLGSSPTAYTVTTPSFGGPHKSYGAHHKTLGDLIGNTDNDDELSTPSERDDFNDDYDEESQDEL